jgi:LysR family transcriptional regulator for metE and metH
MDVEIRDLELLDALATHETLVAAAGKLFVSQPALSQRLGRLETRLGTPLFDREGRRLVPNAAGRRMLVAARHVLSELSAAERDVREASAGRGRRLRFAAQCSTALQWLPELLRTFRARHPAAEVRITSVADDDPIGALLDDLVDVALVTKPDRRMAQVELVPLFEDEMVAVVGPGHPWAGRARVTARDFDDAHVILYDSYDQARIPALPLPLPHGARPVGFTFVPVVTELVVEMVAGSDSVAILPGWVVAPYVRPRGLSVVPLAARGLARTWYCASRTGPRPDHVDDFVAEVVARLSDPAWRQAMVEASAVTAAAPAGPSAPAVAGEASA